MTHFLDIVIPTFNRVEKLKRLLRSIEAQSYKSYKVTVVADNSCEKTKKAYDNKELGGVNFIFNKERKMPIRIWNSYLEKNTDCNLVYLCDDVELEKDCLENAVKYFNSTDRLVGFKQIIKNIDNMCEAAMGIIGCEFANRFPKRNVFCPEYFNMCVDGELLDYAKKYNKFTFAVDARLTHYHPGWYKEEQDSTHSIARSNISSDREIRQDRIKRGLLWGENV